MTYFNQFHKESVERCLRKIAQSKSLQLNSDEEIHKMQQMHQELRVLYPNDNESTRTTLGFEQTAEASFSNGYIEVSDLRPRNVLRDSDGDMYMVDAEFKTK